MRSGHRREPYGGLSREGALASDAHVPPRFFALRTDDEMQRLVAPYFEVVNFHAVPVDRAPHTVPLGDDDFHFQSLTLRRPRTAV